MLKITSCLLISLFASLGAAGSFTSCVVRGILSIDQNSDVEDATGAVLEAISSSDIEPPAWWMEVLPSYVQLLLETDCSDVQARIDEAFSSEDNIEKLGRSLYSVAMMEAVHDVDALVAPSGRRDLFAVLGGAVFALGGSSLAVFGAGCTAILGVGIAAQVAGRRQLSEIVSVVPSDVMVGCANGAKSPVCSLSFTEIAKDFSMTTCGGSDDMFTCDISTESLGAAFAELAGAPASYAMNLGQKQEKGVGYRLRKVNKSLRLALNALVN